MQVVRPAGVVAYLDLLGIELHRSQRGGKPVSEIKRTLFSKMETSTIVEKHFSFNYASNTVILIPQTSLFVHLLTFFFFF